MGWDMRQWGGVDMGFWAPPPLWGSAFGKGDDLKIPVPSSNDSLININIAGRVSSADSVPSTGSSTLIHLFDHRGFSWDKAPSQLQLIPKLCTQISFFLAAYHPPELGQGEVTGWDFIPGTLQQQWQEGTAGKAQGETIASNTNTMRISKQGWREGDAGTFGVKQGTGRVLGCPHVPPVRTHPVGFSVLFIWGRFWFLNPLAHIHWERLIPSIQALQPGV